MKQKETTIFEKGDHYILDCLTEISNSELIAAIQETNPDTETLSVALCTALSDMDIDKTLTLLKAGADPNYQNGSPLIILATNIESSENNTMLDLLVEFGCKMDGGNGQNQGFTLAVAEENTMLVKKCIEHGGIVLPFRQSEALQTAVRTGNLEIVQMVAEADPSQNFKECLCIACEEEHLPVIDYLLTKVNIQDLKHEPLERAAFFEANKAITHLIDNYQYPVNQFDNSFVFTAIKSKDEEFNNYVISKTENPQSIFTDSAVMDYITLNKPLLTTALLTRMVEAEKAPSQNHSTHQQIMYSNNQQNSL